MISFIKILIPFALFFLIPSSAIAQYPSLFLSVNPYQNQSAFPIINYSEKPLVNNDLAWKKTAYASSFYEQGYPSNATAGTKQPWRTASSTGTWFYVDLLQEEIINSISTTLFIDSNFSSAPRTQYIVSDNLSDWQIVYDEINGKNLVNRGQTRTLTLPKPIKARYVGLYAQDWSGGWADMTQFSVTGYHAQPNFSIPINPIVYFIITIALFSSIPYVLYKYSLKLHQ